MLKCWTSCKRNAVKGKKTLVTAVAIEFVLMFLVAPVLPHTAAADPLNNAVTRQRIGNYDFQVGTTPNPPVAGQTAKVMLRIAGVNGDDLVDVPLTLRIGKAAGGGEGELRAIGPFVVPFGHYEFDHVFSEPGRYVIYADLQDYAYSGETLTFTFFLNVAGPNDYLFLLVPGVGAAAAGAAGAIVIVRRRRHKNASA